MKTTKTTSKKKAEPKKSTRGTKKAAAPVETTEAKVEAPVEPRVEIKAETPVEPKVDVAPSLPRPPAVRIDWELSAAWEVVNLVERGEQQDDGLEPNLKNFIQYGQSSLTSYEVGKMVEGLLRESAQGLAGADFLSGDRVRFSLQGEGYESQGFVFGVEAKSGNPLRILAVDPRGQFVALANGEGGGEARILGIISSGC
jgi:hypothetical protein